LTFKYDVLLQEEIWVSGSDFSAAVADPLRECAVRIVEDMNRKHWEDVRRFCKSHARLDVEVLPCPPTLEFQTYWLSHAFVSFSKPD
jgi:hypothetical protein